MKTLSLKQLRFIKSTYDEIKIGVYNYCHIVETMRLIMTHYNPREIDCYAIRQWHKKYFVEAIDNAERKQRKKDVLAS